MAEKRAMENVCIAKNLAGGISIKPKKKMKSRQLLSVLT